MCKIPSEIEYHQVPSDVEFDPVKGTEVVVCDNIWVVDIPGQKPFTAYLGPEDSIEDHIFDLLNPVEPYVPPEVDPRIEIASLKERLEILEAKIANLKI